MANFHLLIREASLSDIPHMVALLEKLFSIEKDFTFSQNRQQRGLEYLLRSSTSTAFVAKMDEMVVGMVTGQLTISTAEGGNSLLVEDLFVERNKRGKGIGKKLLEKISHWGSKNNASRMQLLADRNNKPALYFYESSNWKETQLICLRKYYCGEE